MMIDVNDNEISIDKKPTVGERLSHARQAKKLTIADIATELRLTKQTIECIENERWGELHGRAYARGYFSNYVKFLGLPEDELLAAFNIEYKVVEPTLLTTQYQVETSDKKIFWLSGLLLIIVLAIGWFAYQQMQNTADVVAPEEASPLPAVIPLDNDVIETDEASKEYESIVVPDVKQEMNELEQPVSSDTEFLDHSEQTEASLNENTETAISNELVTVALPEDFAQESVINDVIPVNTAVISANSILDLRFSDDCWVEVKDADNKLLLNKLMTKNDSIVLNGRTPLTVMLGRTSVAQVRFNDKLFDPSAFSQRGVARFTLGAES